MVTASTAQPARWRVSASHRAHCWRASVSLAPGVSRRLTFNDQTIEKHADDPAAIAAARSEPGRRFLGWARLPYYRIERGSRPTRVEIIDARYGASVAVKLD